MFKLLTLLLSNNTKSQFIEDKSFIDIKVRINEKLLKQLLTWLLSISIAGGGMYVLNPFNNKVSDIPNQTESVKLPSNLKQ